MRSAVAPGSLCWFAVHSVASLPAPQTVSGDIFIGDNDGATLGCVDEDGSDDTATFARPGDAKPAVTEQQRDAF